MLIFHAYYWLGMHDMEQMYVFAPWGVRRYTRKRVYVAKRRLYKGQKISKANYGFLDSPKNWSHFKGLFCYIDFPFYIRVNWWKKLGSFTKPKIFAFKIKIIFSSRFMLNFSSHIFYPKTACNSETNDKSNESSKIGHAIS